MNIAEMLQGVDCSCGKFHRCDIGYVFIENNAITHLKDICKDFNKILLVADENTYTAAGKKVEAQLTDKQLSHQIFFGKTVLIPNEDAIQAVEEKMFGIELIIGIGSGVIQDLCKYISFNAKIPYYIVATAPSMDGYASTGAAMITDGMKVTYSAKVPDAFIGDTEVLKDAPMEMIKAGYGDIVGKYSALNDWKLSHTVLGEYFCQYIYDLTLSMLKKTLPLSKKLLERDEDSIRTLTEALVVVGIAMSFAGSSRPASGSEHHLSHFFEITGIVDGEAYLPHGIDVAYSTVITAKLREKLLYCKFPQTQYQMDENTYKSEMQRVYKSVAEGCMTLQNKMGRYGENRVPVYLAKEEQIKSILSEMPSTAEIETILSGIGLSMDEFHKTYSEAKIADAITYAKDIKDRYTVLWVYYDIFGKEII